MPTIDFQRIRSAPKSRNDSFEALSVQLFRASFKAPIGSHFRSLRGDGGDGGVEAFFQTPSNEIIGVQAKYFFKLDASELAQIEDSLCTALFNHPTLSQYWVYIPFDLTGKVAGGRRGKSQTERFDEWRVLAEMNAAKRGLKLSIILCGAATIRDQLQKLDAHGGLRRYWFDDTVLTENHIQRCLDQAKAFAGPRYFAALDVTTHAHEMLDFFGGTGDFEAWREGTLAPVLAQSGSLLSRCEEAFTILPGADGSKATKIFAEICSQAESIKPDADIASLARAVRDNIARLTPLAKKARELQEAAFTTQHGANADSPGFRQFHAEYMCAFPAGPMDCTRDIDAVLTTLDEALMSPSVQASTTQSLLLVGPGGTGKTHALVSAAQRRLQQGGYSLVVFGDDFGGPEPWEVLRTKLGFGGDVARDTLFECLQACAENTELPFVISIDALNESPRNARWKTKLPELLEQCKPYPGVKVCVSVRDSYRRLVVDASFPGIAFRHAGFEGREFEALQAFATYYGLDAEITPLFANELSNPLFLHLACQTLKEQGRRSLDVSLPGFSSLFESHLAYCDRSVRTRLSYVNPRNLVRAAMIALAEVLVVAGEDRIWSKCVDAIRPLVGSELSPEALLGELQHEGLVILSGDEDAECIVRLGYQRYGDVLRALHLLELATGVDGKVDPAALKQFLESLADEDAGLLEVLSAVLPERAGMEITDSALGLDIEKANRLFITGLPWRSRDSIPHDIRDHILEALTVPNLWQDVYEVFFKLSLVPDHRLNAGQWLNLFLNRQSLADRDAFLSLAAFKSFDNNGAVKSLIEASLRADLRRWPSESLWLAGLVLGWLTSCADRRVRDQATKGLARIFGHNPEISTEMIRMFEESDDDYILESIALATYSACLLHSGPLNSFVPALEAFVYTRYDSPNVLIRDPIRLLALKLADAGISKHLSDQLNKYPSHVNPPNPWPTVGDAEPLLSLEHLPSNMKLWGQTMGSDFWRYQVEPRLRQLDLKGGGVTLENAASWIMLEALKLGSPGDDSVALNYDRAINREFGGGRARKGYADRLGKKYYWIALHRLLGVLADNVGGAKGYSGFTPGPDHFWSTDVRKSDPTDVRDIVSGRQYPDDILQGPKYDFAAFDSDIKSWVRANDFTPHVSCLIRSTNDGVEWVAMSLSADGNNLAKGEMSWSTPYLTVSLFYTSVFAPSTRMRNDFLQDLDSAFSSNPSGSYRAYIGEYPSGPVFFQREDTGQLCLDEDGFEFSEVALLRGNEWEYDYSAISSQETLHVPCRSMVEALDLTWDRQRGWVEPGGQLIVFEAKAKGRSGLFVRRDSLNKYLEQTAAVLLFRRFTNRGFIDQRGDGSMQIDVNTILRYEPKAEPTVLAEEEAPYNC